MNLGILRTNYRVTAGKPGRVGLDPPPLLLEQAISPTKKNSLQLNGASGLDCSTGQSDWTTELDKRSGHVTGTTALDTNTGQRGLDKDALDEPKIVQFRLLAVCPVQRFGVCPVQLLTP